MSKKKIIVKRRWLKMSLCVAVLGVGVALYAGCDGAVNVDGDCIVLENPPTKASDWVSYVDWTKATRVEITAEETSENSFRFSPSSVQFLAGQPYILVMKSPQTNQEKHYFHAPDFYKAIATRKAQTSEAEYKAPYFDDFELKVNGELELYFVPVRPGTYSLLCTITGHKEKGMEGTLTILCDQNLSLDLEVDQNFNTALGSDPRRSGSNDVWATAQTQTVTMKENSETHFVFDPDNVTLTPDLAYILKLQNPAGNSSKHYYTAATFYQTLVTRKAEDSKAEIKVPYFKAIELLIGGTTDLYIVPTVEGTYNVLCTVTGHADAGMTGTITVEHGDHAHE